MEEESATSPRSGAGRIESKEVGGDFIIIQSTPRASHRSQL